MRPRVWLCLACLPALLFPVPTTASRLETPCRPQITGALRTQGPVDGILSLPSSAAVLLVGRRRGDPQYLPHDRLVLIDTRRLQVRRSITLPLYAVPPGLTALNGGKEVAAVVDDRLLVLQPSGGARIRWWHLDVQAVGWPAAVIGAARTVYLAGQPQSSSQPTAVLEALVFRSMVQAPHLAWRQRLGLTHAGIWLGLAGSQTLATYLPDSHDLTGSVATWNARTGALLGSYAVPGPALAATPALDRVFVGAANRIYTRRLRSGKAVAVTAGLEPIAVDGPRRLLLFVRGRQIVVASARTLRPFGAIPLAGARALSPEPGGATLLVGHTTGVVRVDLGSCEGP